MELTLARPDDWHLHVRDGEALAAVIPHTARQFARAIIMPNLQPPVTTTDQALSYHQRTSQTPCNVRWKVMPIIFLLQAF